MPTQPSGNGQATAVELDCSGCEITSGSMSYGGPEGPTFRSILGPLPEDAVATLERAAQCGAPVRLVFPNVSDGVPADRDQPRGTGLVSARRRGSGTPLLSAGGTPRRSVVAANEIRGSGGFGQVRDKIRRCRGRVTPQLPRCRWRTTWRLTTPAWCRPGSSRRTSNSSTSNVRLMPSPSCAKMQAVISRSGT